MEEKMRRESKMYVEKLFKQFDKHGSGAIPRTDMQNVVEKVVGSEFTDGPELAQLLLKHAKRNKYSFINPKTKQIEYQYQEDTIDFPSALAITVHFLTKMEMKESNAFAGQGLIRFADLDRRPSVLFAETNADKKKKLY